MRANRELVAHSAGQDKECGFVVGSGCEVSFEVVGSGVLGEDVVEESSVRDSG